MHKALYYILEELVLILFILNSFSYMNACS